MLMLPFARFRCGALRMKLHSLRQSGILIATNNANKVRELSAMLGELSIPVRVPAELGISIEVDETGTTFLENALMKARAFFEAARIPVLADDSGLVVDALAGEPGVYSARYGGSNLTDTDRIAIVLSKMQKVAAHLRQARFVCSLVFLEATDEYRTYEGIAEGRILAEPEGADGFGYDPIFEDLLSGRSYASISADEKNERSHRGKALQQFLADLQRL